MSIYEEQLAKFGKTCKWLDCDSWCHFTKCALNQAMQDRFFDRLKELKVQFPEVYTEMFSGSCNVEDFSCFEKEDKPLQYLERYDDEESMTELEKQAEEIAVEKLKDDNYVMGLYREAKKKYIERRRKDVAKIEKILKKMEDANE